MNKRLLGAGAALLAAAAAYFWWAPGRAPAMAAVAPGGAISASGAASGAAGRPAGGPVSVSAIRVQQRDVDVQLEATGMVTAANIVEVRPQVNSVITKVHVREGQSVKAGELLFTLDARTDAANVARAQAQLAKDQATLADARRQLARSRELLAQNFISQAAVDTNLSLVDSQAAVVAASKVAIDAARVGLSYGRITAPGAGRVGAVNVFAGSSVQANATTLATITQLDPIFVTFNLPQRHVSDALASLKAGGGQVAAALPEAKGVLRGRLQFVDSAIDGASGTVKVKAVFDNKAQALWPGAFVNVKMTVQTLKDAVVVPQAAIVQGQRGRNVFVIEAGNKIAARPVEMVQPLGLDAVVTGLRAGERVVMDGRQNVRPGTVVVERAADAAQPARGGASGAASGTAAGPAAPGLSASAGATTTNPAPQP